MLRDLLTNPDAFFADVAEDGGLVRPVLIVALVGLVGALGSIPLIRATTRALPPEAGPIATIFMATGAIATFVGAFVAWLLYAGAFHGISGLVYDPEGSFTETLSVTGWGFVPAVFGAVVSVAASFYVFGRVTFPADPMQVGAFAAELQSRPAFVVAGIVGIAFLLWQGFLWTFGLKHVRGITLREAAITVATPVAVAVLFRLWGLVP